MAGQPLGRLAPWVMLVLTALACPAVAAIDYALSVRPVWGGHVKPGIPSEVGISLLANRGGQARLTLHASRSTVHIDTVFEAGIPREIHLPISHDSALPVEVTFDVDAMTVQEQSLSLHVLPADGSVVAVVDPGANFDWRAWVAPAENATVIHAAAAELPHTGQAYGLLSALFMAESALWGMNDQQRRALAAYAAGCGRLYLTGATSSEAQALLGVAGCGARNVVVARPADGGTAPAEIIDPPAAGATLATLATLLPEGRDTVLRSLVVFLLGYVCVLLIGARSAKTASALLVLPPAATILAVLAWHLASPRVQVAGLAEMDSGDTAARFAALLRVTGTAPGEIVLGLPVQLGLPSLPEPGRTAEVEFDTAAQRLELRLDAKLMSRHSFRVEGIAPASHLAVDSIATGVRVTNHGDNSSASAILAWRGQRYTVPGLAAGQQWNLPDEPETWGRTAPEQLLRQRATDGGSWLLVPHAFPALRSLAGVTDTVGWLLVRGATDA